MHFSYVNQDFEIIISDHNDILIRNYSNQVGRIWGFTDFVGFIHRTNSFIFTPQIQISGRIKVAELLGQKINMSYKINKQDKLENKYVDTDKHLSKNVKLIDIPDSLWSEYFNIKYFSTKSETLMLVPICGVNSYLFFIPEKPAQFYWEFKIDCCIGDIISTFQDLPLDINPERKLLISSQPKDTVNGVFGPTTAAIFINGYEIKKGDSSIVNINNKSIIVFNSIYDNIKNNVGTYLIYEFPDSLYQLRNMEEIILDIRLIQSDPNIKSNKAWQYGKSALVDRLGTLDYRGKCLVIDIFNASGNLTINEKSRYFKISDVLIYKFEGTVEYKGTPKDELNPLILVRGKSKLILINNEKFTISYFDKMPDIFKWILPSVFLVLLSIFITGKSKKNNSNHSMQPTEKAVI
jgi:hypothetical protein